VSGPATLALFDLDHTLLDGDSDVLWCDFLMDRGVLDRAVSEPRNLAMARDYQAGMVSPQDFCEFYVGTLAGRTRAEWQPLREAFLAEAVRPRLVAEGLACLERHRAAGHVLVLTTATNRYITELTARALGIEHLIATECELGADGRFTGRVSETLNMREGKVVRLHDWLAERGQCLDDRHSVFYSDSINDLPLLSAVREAVVVDADARLEAEAVRRGWALQRWRGQLSQSGPAPPGSRG
jgi:HAD superfamily hydrolase (TIGR01490 family)